MTWTRLLFANGAHHWRGNLAVLLGVAVGTAVLAGALLVGDSLRGSLHDLTLERLGWIDHTLIAPRFFRAELADSLPVQKAAPAVLLQAAVSSADDKARVNKVVLLGVDARFWPGEVPVSAAFWKPQMPVAFDDRPVVLGAALAQNLGVKTGDVVTFHLQKVSAAPRETLLGRRKADEVLTNVPLKVAAVLPDHHFGSRFSLNPTPNTPRNAFVPLAVLQEEIRSQAGKGVLPDQPANALLMHEGDGEQLQAVLGKTIQLDDVGLALRTPKAFPKTPRPGYLSLESQQMFLEPWVQTAVDQAKLKSGPTLVTMINNVATVKQLQATACAALAPAATLTRPWIAYYGPLQTPYSVAAALQPNLPAPLGPFAPEGQPLAAKDMLLVDWAGSPHHNVKAGELMALTYFEPDEEARLTERTVVLRVAAKIPLQGPANDRNLTPSFPGITDKTTLADWESPFPFDRTRLRPRDNQFWTEHRATPRLYVNLDVGQKLWGSRFGKLTSIRIDPAGKTPDEIARLILAQIKPEQANLVIDDLRKDRLEASAGNQDFSELFLGFSTFLIVAALLLVGLLFRLNLERRSGELGLLLAIGWRVERVRNLLLFEGLIIAALGGLLGLGLALGYAWLMLQFLASQWPGGLDRAILRLHVEPLKLAVGYVAAVGVSLVTIRLALRVLARMSPRELLQGATSDSAAETARGRWSPWLIGVGLVGSVACYVIAGFVSDPEMQAFSFFCTGGLLLTAGLAAVSLQLGRTGNAVTGRGLLALTRLAIRNAGRHPTRSLLTVGLLASATFVVVAVQAFHRDAGQDFLQKTGGSGGFALIGESEVPIYQDLNLPQARQELNLPDSSESLFRQCRFMPIRVRAGDDASCLNLYQPRRPRLLGVPNALIERGGFQFAQTEAKPGKEKANPWLLLTKNRDDGAIPVFGELNSVTYNFHTGLGGEISVANDRGEQVKLRIVGLLQDSVFQGELVMAESAFLKLFPRQEGYQMFLIDPGENAAAVKSALEAGLADHGFAVTPATQRLEGYLQVENTYLATFQALGGMGLLLGALGLAVVLLRNVWERRAELALFRALGFRRTALGWLVLAENLYLLLLGLAVGVVAALVAVAPHFWTLVGGGLWLQLLGLLTLVVLIGMTAGALAVTATLRAPLVPALRRE